ncbi:hypothetical protein CANTEDRAFT_104803 [Yamadazyma tenuis ATCC 10573]|uniref:Methyltransferase type 11 domain-containing protein n=2 Tax=Candida tenuis TaxID=2315449 RepID=G3B2Z1_CANTC|nr:uncharacterized protein CANTEDRAFT_104803 [Yamadazyma tenuis ATCC 10573]EGV64038.1 hypothetical protein CANTEDRAFT_104803 [Yamadazyma tenuis ATCC 10573]
MAQVDDFPEFSTIKDLRFLESPGKMQENLYSPSFQVFRFSNFLDILNAQHNNDPINFANIRHNGISKFILRHSEYSNKSIDDDWKPHDMRDFEAPLAYSLIKMRSFLRILIRSQSGKDGKGAELFSCEELVQLNFTNYLRFLLNLPQKFTSTPTNQLDETSAMHQSFKIMFTRIIKALLTFRKEETGDVMSNTTTATSLLLQLITKVSYEFILLEKYHINIITKLGNNSLLDSRVVERLFRQYHKGLSQPPSRRNLPKVLVYNSYFSAQYSWYMCVTIPFLTVVEMAVFNEDQELISDPERYRQQEKNTVKTSFEKSDAMLYASYFKDIKFKNYQKFRSTSDEQFVSIQRANHDNSSVSESLISSSQHKPKNFNFNCESLATIPNATFDVVQSRDLLFQLTNSNYRTIISELHRVLKIGGTLEVPIILSGTDTISPDTTTVGFPKFTNATGLNLSKYYDMIPDFAEVLLKIILEVFGEGNVRMATALLNTTSEMSDFLVKDIGLHIAEMVGETDKYCRASQHPIGERNKDVHFFFQIQAEKTFN